MLMTVTPSVGRARAPVITSYSIHYTKLYEIRTSRLSRGLNAAHFLSAGSVSFARGLNDTPKIVALLWQRRVAVLVGLGCVPVAAVCALSLPMVAGRILDMVRAGAPRGDLSYNFV